MMEKLRMCDILSLVAIGSISPISVPAYGTVFIFHFIIHDFGGKYKPFVPPVVQAPNKGAVITPEADTFILGATVAEHVEIAEGNEVFTTTNGRFTAVTVKEGNRLLDTAFVHIDNDTLSTSMKNNGIWIMDPARKKAAALEVTVWAKGSGRIKIGDTEFTLTSKLTAYTVTVPGAAHIPVEALDHNVTLTTYRTRVLP